jgi:hypothetical protein
LTATDASAQITTTDGYVHLAAIDGDPRGRKKLVSTASLNLFGALLNSIHDLQSVLLLLGRQPAAHNWIIDCRIVFRFCSGPGGRDQTCQIGAPQSDAATPDAVSRDIAFPDLGADL